MGELCDPDDAITMLIYHLSLELRRIPANLRLAKATEASEAILANTRESLD